MVSIEWFEINTEYELKYSYFIIRYIDNRAITLRVHAMLLIYANKLTTGFSTT